MSAQTLDDHRDAAREHIKKHYPLSSRSAGTTEALADAMGYQGWRLGRAYDHIELAYGIRMRDGRAGYVATFFEGPDNLSRSTSIALSVDELRELVGKGQMALAQEA